jgi:two-component system, NarL family, response regulator NreC
MDAYKIILAEDHQGFRRLVRQELGSASDFQVVGEANDGQELLALLEQLTPDLVVLDISMPKLGGIEAAKRIKLSHSEVKILFLSLHKNPVYVEQAQNLGVEGYLLKEEMEHSLVPVINRIRAGHTYFSPILRQHTQDRGRKKEANSENNQP